MALRRLLTLVLSVWILKNDPLTPKWAIFWYFHAINFAELSDSPDLGYFYSFASTITRTVRNTDCTLQLPSHRELTRQ